MSYALKKNGNDESETKYCVARLYRNVAVLDSGASGATTTFTERGIDDGGLPFCADSVFGVKQARKKHLDLST
jgi:sulfate transport system substrate-binding protein